MADRLLIVLMNTDPHNPSEVAAPFFQAAVAASMEYDVEVVLTGRSGELARPGFAAHCFLQEGAYSSVYDLMKQAYEAGVKFKVCTPSLHGHGGELIPEVEEMVGSAYLISQAMIDGTVTFTY